MRDKNGGKITSRDDTRHRAELAVNVSRGGGGKAGEFM